MDTETNPREIIYQTEAKYAQLQADYGENVANFARGLMDCFRVSSGKPSITLFEMWKRYLNPQKSADFVNQLPAQQTISINRESDRTAIVLSDSDETGQKILDELVEIGNSFHLLFPQVRNKIDSGELDNIDMRQTLLSLFRQYSQLEPDDSKMLRKLRATQK